MSSIEPRILLIDNYDSFTFNIREYLGRIVGYNNVIIHKNDQVMIADAMEFDAWVLSPGPGLPGQSGNLIDLIRAGFEKRPILGICLGMQAIAETFGAELINLGNVRHGRQIRLRWTGHCPLVPDTDQLESAGLYHSWAVKASTLPDSLEVSCIDEEGVPMIIQHAKFPVYGVQFHPESILTPGGFQLMEEFIRLTRKKMSGS